LLRHSGSWLNITFTPTGGTPNTEQAKLTIKLKKKHKH
jgi:hypothetical protein